MITQPLCIIAGSSTGMVVCPPLPEASESEDDGGSTGAPGWQLRDWDDYDFPCYITCYNMLYNML